MEAEESTEPYTAKEDPKSLKNANAYEQPNGPMACPLGCATITSGGNLKAKHVIHTVGPIWRGGFYEEAKLLKQAYRSSLKLAVTNRLKKVAFPSISTGAYGYPVEEASRVAVGAVKDFLEKEDKLERVSFVLFSDRDFEIYLRAVKP